MSAKPKRRRSASIKQLSDDNIHDKASVLSEPAASRGNVDETVNVGSDSSSANDMDPITKSDTEPPSDSSMRKKNQIKIKSSRRASFQLSNTINSHAKASGVDHLIGIVNSEGKKGMREQINELKEEIEAKGLTQYIDTVNGYSMSGEIKMLKKVLEQHGGDNISQSENNDPENSKAVKQIEKIEGTTSNSETGDELNLAKETIKALETKISRLEEESAENREMEDQLCDLEDQLLKANKARVDGVNEVSQLRKRITELESEVHAVTEEATNSIQELEKMLDDSSSDKEEFEKVVASLVKEKRSHLARIAELEESNKVLETDLGHTRNSLDISLLREKETNEELIISTRKQKEYNENALKAAEDIVNIQRQHDTVVAQNVNIVAENNHMRSRIDQLEKDKIQLQFESTQAKEKLESFQLESARKTENMKKSLEDAINSRNAAVSNGSKESAIVISNLQSQLNDLKEEHMIELGKMEKNISDSVAEAESVASKCLSIEQDNAKLTMKLQAASEEENSKDATIAEKNHLIESLEKSLQKSSNSCQELSSTVDSLNLKIARLQEELSDLNGCKEDDSRLQHALEEKARIETLYFDLKENLSLNSLEDMHKSQIESLKKELLEAKELSKTVPLLQKRLHELENAPANSIGSDSQLSPSTEDMQNDIDLLLSKMATAEKEFQKLQNEHEIEVSSMKEIVESAVNKQSVLESNLSKSYEEIAHLKELVEKLDDQLKEKSHIASKAEISKAELQAQLSEAQHGLLLRNESSDDMEKLFFRKESELVKLHADNEFYQRRVESLQKKVVILNNEHSHHEGKTASSKELRLLRHLLRDLDKKNSCLVLAIENERHEKDELKRMLKATYSDVQEQYKAENGIDSKSGSALWGAMNKGPAFMGYDVIFKVENLSASPTQQKSPVIQNWSGDASLSNINCPINYVSLFQSQVQLHPRVSAAVERLVIGWSVNKVYSKKNPRERIMRLDLSSGTLLCLPLSDASSPSRKRGVKLSLIKTVCKSFDSNLLLQSTQYSGDESLMLCIEVSGGSFVVLRFDTQDERDDFFDGISFLLLKFVPSYKDDLLDSVKSSDYHSSLYLQSIIACTTKSGEERFEFISIDGTATNSVAESEKDNGKKDSRRVILTKKGSDAKAKPPANDSLSFILQNVTNSASRKLSLHEHVPSTISALEKEESSHQSSQSVVRSDEESCAPVSSAPKLSEKNDSVSSFSVSTPPTSTPEENKASGFSFSSSIFSVLNKKPTNVNDVEINGVDALYGSERAEDRRHSVNLSREKGRRKSQYSFVSENPAALDFSLVDGPDSNALNQGTDPRRRRRSSLFAHCEDSDAGNGGKDTDQSSSTSKPRRLSASTLAKANLLQLSLNESNANEISSEPAENANKSQLPLDKKNTDPPTSREREDSIRSVGAENLKRFGSTLTRSSSGAHGTRERSRSNFNAGTRSTLMNVDSESLEQLRQKTRRRASASKELAAQTNMLKQKLMARRENASCNDGEDTVDNI